MIAKTDYKMMDTNNSDYDSDSIASDEENMMNGQEPAGVSNERTGSSKNAGTKVALNEIQDLNRYFRTMIDTIPARIYFIKNEEIIENMDAKKYASAEESRLSAKSFQKRSRLNFETQQKVSDIAAQFYEKKQTGSKMNELKKKLAKRIKELKGNRPEKDNNKPKDTRVGVKRTNDGIVNGARDSNNNNNHSSSNGKAKKTKFNNNVQFTDDSDDDEDDDDYDDNDASDDDDNDNRRKNSESKEDGTLPQFVFSKFDFARQTDLAAEKKMSRNKQKKKSLKEQLADAEKEERALQNLASRDPVAAGRVKMEKMWNSALERAEGNKVHDDTKKLSQKVKQKDRKKVKSAKEWQERTEAVEARKDKRQDQRNRNIEQRKTQKKDKKIKRRQKKLGI